MFSLAVLGAFALAGGIATKRSLQGRRSGYANKAAEALELLNPPSTTRKTTKFGEIHNKAGKCSRILFQPLLVNAANSQPLDTVPVHFKDLDDMVIITPRATFSNIRLMQRANAQARI